MLQLMLVSCASVACRWHHWAAAGEMSSWYTTNTATETTAHFVKCQQLRLAFHDHYRTWLPEPLLTLSNINYSRPYRPPTKTTTHHVKTWPSRLIAGCLQVESMLQSGVILLPDLLPVPAFTDDSVQSSVSSTQLV